MGSAGDPRSVGPGVWSPPQCPFVVHYDPVVLDDIRMAVTDAFFSVPRGGVEIGGVLFGTRSGREIRIQASEPLACEHAFGPSFTLSEKDHASLRRLVDGSRGNPRLRDLEPLGWYHSHTRSEIQLSEADLAVHERYFPEAWQVALVMKPSTFQPARAGFFFREAGGAIRTESSHLEFKLQPLGVRPAPAGPPEAERGPSRRPPRVVEEAPAEPAPAPAPTPPPAGQSAEPPLEIRLPYMDDRRRKRRVMWTLVFLLAAVAGGVAGYQTRTQWAHYVFGPVPGAEPEAPPVVPAPAPASAGLTVADNDGQLQIRWDRTAKAVLEARTGGLEIVEATGVKSVELDRLLLGFGSFTYARQTERVDVRLWLEQPGGTRVHEAATFMGGLPLRRPPPEDPKVRAEREALTRESARLKKDLGKQVERTKKLEDSLEDMRKQMQREQQRRRLENQNPEPL